MKIKTRMNLLINQDFTRLEIIDDASGRPIISAEIPMQEFQQLLSRLAYVPVEMELSENFDYWGKEKIVETWTCPKSKGYDKSYQKDQVRKWFAITNEIRDNEWQIYRDGTDSQQPSDQHEYIVCKYVTPTEENKNEDLD